ncbi:rhamnan synthesis F family protein [Roseiarcus fermentans]|nr:rhamnan synthesis F family protein [Roseiarcus fermentans]
MSRFRSFFRRAYRLRPLEPQAHDHIAQLRVEGRNEARNLLLPYSIGLGYFALPAGAGGLVIETADFSVERLDALTSLWARLRLALLFKKKKSLVFPDFSVFCYGPKPERKRFTTFNQHMFNIGVSLDGDLIAAHPELLDGWDDETAPRGARGGPTVGNPLAIVVHLYYEETWGDIGGVLRRLSVPFDLIVTTTPGRERLVESIRREFPRAEIEVMDNRGRDVRPFLTLLERGRLDRYRYVCKLHGKKSTDGGRKSYMGSLWRRRLLFDLLAAPGLAQSILDLFERDPSIGMVGPGAFRLPSRTYSEALSWSTNRERVLELAERMGVPRDRFRLDFFGGTMFWVRPEALAPLRSLALSAEFPEEKGLLDGGLEHATERLFGAAVVAAGYRLADSDGYSAAIAGSGGAPTDERRTGLG